MNSKNKYQLAKKDDWPVFLQHSLAGDVVDLRLVNFIEDILLWDSHMSSKSRINKFDRKIIGDFASYNLARDVIEKQVEFLIESQNEGLKSFFEIEDETRALQRYILYTSFIQRSSRKDVWVSVRLKNAHHVWARRFINDDSSKYKKGFLRSKKKDSLDIKLITQLQAEIKAGEENLSEMKGKLKAEEKSYAELESLVISLHAEVQEISDQREKENVAAFEKAERDGNYIEEIGLKNTDLESKLSASVRDNQSYVERIKELEVEVKKQSESHANKIETLEKDIKHHKDRLIQAQENHDKTLDEFNVTSEKNQQELIGDLAAVKEASATIEAESAQTKKDNQLLLEKYSLLEIAHKESQEKINRYEVLAVEKDNEIDVLKDAEVKNLKSIEELTVKADELDATNKTLDLKEAELLDKASSIKNLEDQLISAHKSLDEEKQNKEELRLELTDSKSSVETLKVSALKIENLYKGAVSKTQDLERLLVDSDKQLNSVTEDLVESEMSNANLTKSLSEANEKIELLLTQKGSDEQQLKQLESNHRDEIAELEKIKADNEAEVSALNEKVNNFERVEDLLKKQLSDEQLRSTELTALADQRWILNESLSKSEGLLHADIEVLNDNLTVSNKEAESLREELTSVAAAASSNEKKFGKKIALLTSEVDEYQERLAASAKKYESLDALLIALKVKYKEKLKQLRQLENQ